MRVWDRSPEELVAGAGAVLVLPSGAETAVARVRDLLGALGTVTYAGPTGANAI